MRQRVPLVISCTALLVAVLGATSPGQAAVRGLEASVPFAKASGYAATAGNAAKLNGHASSTSGKAGTIPVVGKNGKLPASLGAIGPQGPAGPAGAGTQVDLSKLLSNNVDVVAKSLTMNGSVDTESVACPSPQYEAVAGGIYTGDATVVTSGSWPQVTGRAVSDGPPDSDSGPPTGWVTRASTPGLTPAKNVLVRWYAVCVRVGS